MSTIGCDAIVLIAFGGPETMQDVRPFLENVLAGRAVPGARFEEVVRHYEVIGGRSPLNELTERQARALQARLAGLGIELPVLTAMRNWKPYIRDTLGSLMDAGKQRVLGIIMAALETEASRSRYMAAVQTARQALGDAAPKVDFTPSFGSCDGFLQANAENVQAALAQLPQDARAGARLIFTAHSIPVSMAEDSPYVAQLEQAARAVAKRLGRDDYRIAYQSRSGSPDDRWLEPDINDVIKQEAASGCQQLVLCPIGFVCDHVEILYDLDVEAAKTAAEAGLSLQRAAAANDHPRFVEALAEIVKAALKDCRA